MNLLSFILGMLVGGVFLLGAETTFITRLFDRFQGKADSDLGVNCDSKPKTVTDVPILDKPNATDSICQASTESMSIHDSEHVYV